MKKMLSVLLIPYALWLSFGYDYHFIDGANLLFHEAGHLFLRPFGDWLQFLGGSIGQLAFPLGTSWYFWREQKPFETAICLFWAGENLMNIAHYMADAKLQQLPLVGGGIHDWGWMFGQLGWLNAAERLGGVLHFFASLLVLACTVFLLRHSWRPPAE